MFKSILPQASFARFAEGRLDFDGDDEEYSHYLTRFADQQSLARRLMGGNVRHYNSRQQEKDAGAVNRGDFLFFGGARTKGQAEGPPPKPTIPVQAKQERKRIAAKIVTKAPKGEIPYEERKPVAVFDTTQVVDLSADALKKDLFGEQIKEVLGYGCKFNLSDYDSVKMDDELKKINEELQKVNYKDTFRIASAAFNRYDYVCRNMPKKKNDPNFIEEVRTYCGALDELSSLINMYQRKKQPILEAAKKLNLTRNKTQEQKDDLFELEDTLGMYTDYEREITALKFYTEQIRESYYGKLKKLDEDEYEFTQTGMKEIQDAYPDYKLSTDQLLQIYKNRKAKKDDFDGFDKDELARIQKGEAIQVVSDDEADEDNEVNNVVDAIVPADTTKPKAKKKPKKQKKNLDLIDVKSTPVKNDTVKDTTGSNGVGFDVQPAAEQDKRSVSHEQRVGAANDVSSILQASKPKVQYDVRQRRLAHRKAFQERVKSRIDPLSDEKLKEAKNNKRELVEEHELEEEFERPEHDRQSKKYWDRIQKVKQEKLEKQREENRRAEIAMDELITEEKMAERKRVEKRHEEYWRKREEKWNAEKEREKQLQIVPYVDPQSQKIKRDMDEYQWEAVDDNVATNLQVKEEWQGNKPKIAKAHANLENALRKKWFRQTWLGQKIWRPAQKKVAVEAVQDAAAANVADGPVAAAVAAKTAVEAEAQADEANLVSNSSYRSVRKPISLIEQEFDDLERELNEPELVPAEPALPEFVPPVDPAPLPVAPDIESLSEDEDEKPEKKSDPYDRMMDLLAGDSKNATKLMKYKKFKAQQEKERNKRLEDNLKWFSDRMQERRGHSSSGSLSGFKKWDPFSQPLNKNFRTQKMENRLQQTVPPYDLPKNYPIYGGAMPGYPRVNSVPYPVYARRGRTGRRTNYEKYGVPSVRMYQQMLRNGLPPNVVARTAGRPRAVPQPPVEEQNIGPTPQYMPEYDDGPTYAEDRSYDYGQQVQKIAKNLMWGPPRRYTTGNQIVGSVLPNTTSGMPSAYYMGAKALDYITPEGQTDKEKLENMLANVKITQMVEDVKSEDDKKRLREMAKNFGNLNESGWKKALRWGATGASLGLKGLGVLSENFWPMHDAYYRYKTMSSLGGIGKSLLGMMPRGFGYRRRKKRSNKKCRKGKVCYGGMIIPPKSLKKMFEENKCDLKY